MINTKNLIIMHHSYLAKLGILFNACMLKLLILKNSKVNDKIVLFQKHGDLPFQIYF